MSERDQVAEVVDRETPRILDAVLFEVATSRQLEHLEAIQEADTFGAAAAKVGVSPLTIYQSYRSILRKAAKVGHGLNQDAVLPGFAIQERTVSLDESGTITKQWVRTKAGAVEQYESIREAFQDYFAPLRNQAKARLYTPSEVEPDLLAVYPMGDPHIGMYAWLEECEQDFDLEIAEDNLCRAVDVLIAKTEPAMDALLINVGDYYHSDNYQNKTARSGHNLDVDGRWPKVLRVGANIQRYMISALLTKHLNVTVWNVPGNHDDQSAIALNLAMEFLWEGQDRVTIQDNANPFFYHRFGEVLLGSTHGDTIKMPALPGLMASDRKEDWGCTSYRHWYTGHVHHDRHMSSQEYSGVTVESLRTLAPKDYYAHSHGYRSDQEMKADVWHRKFGRASRSFVNLKQLWSEGGQGEPK